MSASAPAAAALRLRLCASVASVATRTASLHLALAHFKSNLDDEPSSTAARLLPVLPSIRRALQALFKPSRSSVEQLKTTALSIPQAEAEAVTGEAEAATARAEVAELREQLATAKGSPEEATAEVTELRKHIWRRRMRTGGPKPLAACAYALLSIEAKEKPLKAIMQLAHYSAPSQLAIALHARA